MKKILLIVLILGAGILSVAFFYMQKKDVRQTESTLTTEIAAQTETKDSKSIDFDWTIEELGENEDFIPIASIKLNITGAANQRYDLGNFSGNCFEIHGSNWERLKNEISGVICWWAGGGEEIGVFEENGRLEIKKGVLEEGGPDAENLRGNFKTISPVPLLED